MSINAYPIIRSLASLILPAKLMNRPGSGGTFSSEYCYSVWLRHLHYLLETNLIKDVSQIERIAEIGPGDSLGIGMTALYTGAKNYFAFDMIEHANLEANQKINNDLKEFFKAKKDIPHGGKFKNTSPILENYTFPDKVLNWPAEYYTQRHNQIDKALKKDQSTELTIKYVVPWMHQENHDIDEIDLIFSQAVMEHVSDIKYAYQQMYKWLKKGGIISHQVDFKTHEMTKEWNGHWFIGKKTWDFLLMGRKYPINRLPLSSHLEVIKSCGFTIKKVVPVETTNPKKGKNPVVPGIKFDEKDLITSGALILAVK